jgi:hypothetical protein
MTDSSELVAVELTERERKFIQHALYQWQFSATSQPFPFQALGLSSTWDEFDELTGRLSYAIIGSEALTDLDWARVLYLVESSWASDLVGAGLGFATVTGFSDTEAVAVCSARLAASNVPNSCFRMAAELAPPRKSRDKNPGSNSYVASRRDGSIPPGCNLPAAM